MQQAFLRQQFEPRKLFDLAHGVCDADGNVVVGGFDGSGGFAAAHELPLPVTFLDEYGFGGGAAAVGCQDSGWFAHTGSLPEDGPGAGLPLTGRASYYSNLREGRSTAERGRDPCAYAAPQYTCPGPASGFRASIGVPALRPHQTRKLSAIRNHETSHRFFPRPCSTGPCARPNREPVATGLVPVRAACYALAETRPDMTSVNLRRKKASFSTNHARAFAPIRCLSSASIASASTVFCSRARGFTW